jgi:hypothetical protein
MILGVGKDAALDILSERIRPTALAREQVLPVPEPFAPVLPWAGLRRGSTVSVTAAGVGGGTSLALALVAAASQAGSWTAAVGLPSLGLVAADEAGIALERLVLVAAPERAAWGGVVAALVDGFDVLLLHATRGGVRQVDARRLVARARERGTVLVQLGPGWEAEADLALRIVAARWHGVDDGYGHLTARRIVLEATGRGAAARPRRTELWLPAVDAPVAAVEPDAEPGAEPQAEPERTVAPVRRLRRVG